MLIQILQHTPLWVWALLAGLIGLGMLQARDRVMKLRRVVLIPLLMCIFSLYGTASAFGATLTTFVPWLTACAAMVGVMVLSTQAGQVRYDRKTGQFFVPGSWFPMVVILAIFFTKYTTGVLLAMHPTLAHDPSFALGMSVLYGLLSGFFVGRLMTMVPKAW